MNKIVHNINNHEVMIFHYQEHFKRIMFFEMVCKEYQYLNLNPPPPHHSITTSPHTLQWITYSESLVRIAAHSWQRCNACIDRTPDWISTENHIPLCEPYCLVGLWGCRRNTWRSCVDAEQWYWDNAGKDSGAIFLLQDLKEREQFWYYLSDLLKEDRL